MPLPPGCWPWASSRATASASGRRTMRSGWSRSSPPPRPGLILVNINPAYRLTELEYALNKVGCKALVTADQLQDQRLSRHAARAGARAGPQRAGSPVGGALAGAGDGDPASARMSAPACSASPISRRLWHGAMPGALGRARGDAAVRRSDQHPVHQRHHRRAQGRDAHPPQILNNGFFIGEAQTPHARTTGSASRCRSITASAWCSATSPASPMARRWSIPARASTPWPSWRPSQAERCTALYGVPTMFIAELDHPEFKRFDLASLRTGIMAGSPCPIEVMRRVRRRDAHGRGDDRLRHDRDQPGQLPERAPTIRWSGASRPSAASIPHVEVKIVDAEGRIVPRGHAGELCTRGYSVMRGLLGRCRAHARGDRPRRLDAHRRPRRRSTPRATATSSAGSRTW